MVFLRVLLLYVIIFVILAICIKYLKWIGRKGKPKKTNTTIPQNAEEEKREDRIRQTPPVRPMVTPDTKPQDQQNEQPYSNSHQPQDAPYRETPLKTQEPRPEEDDSDEELKNRRKRKNLIITGIVICVVILAFVLGRHSGKGNQPGNTSDSSLTETPAMEDSTVEDTTSDDVDQDDDNYDWLQGTWVGQTPYGTVQLIIAGNHIKSQDNSGISTGTFNIQNRQIIATYKSGQTLTYSIDTNKYRIGYGKGIYLYKGSSDTQMDESSDEDNEDNQEQETNQKTEDNSKDQNQEKVDSSKHSRNMSKLQNRYSKTDKTVN